MSKRGEFNKTIIPFAFVGYEIGCSPLGAIRASLAITISYPTRAHGIIAKYPLFKSISGKCILLGEETSISYCK